MYQSKEMTKFVVLTERREIYYKLPNNIETLDDTSIDRYYYNHEALYLKLKDNDEFIRIEPTYQDDGGFIDVKNHAICDEKDAPFYESDDEEEDSDEEALCPELDKLSLQIEKQHYENVKLDEIDD